MSSKKFHADVKNGIARLEDSLDVIESMEVVWRFAFRRLRNRADRGQTVVGALPVSTATQGPFA